MGIRSIRIGSGRLRELPQLLEELGARQVYLLADHNTWKAAGQQAANRMEGMGLPFHGRIFQTEKPLVPDEYAVGSALAAMEPGDDLILAVGSGTLNDTARILSARTGVPYAIVATAPSMDGFASTVSPLILDGKKITKPAVYPAAILADTSIMKDAPMPMLTAGFGDIIGKYTALADWRLSRDLNGEYYCEECAALMARAVEKCAGKRRWPAPAGRAGGGVRHRGAGALGHRHGHGGQLSARLRRGASLCPHLGGGRPGPGGGAPPARQFRGGWRRWSPPPCTSWRRTCCPRASSGRTRPASSSVWRRRGACADPKSLGIRRTCFSRACSTPWKSGKRFTILRFLDGKALLPPAPWS